MRRSSPSVNLKKYSENDKALEDSVFSRVFLMLIMRYVFSRLYGLRKYKSQIKEKSETVKGLQNGNKI